jgi:hypothetical protein
MGFCDPNDVPNITSTLGLNNAGGAREAINEIGRRNITLVVIFSGFVYGDFLGFKIFDGSLHILVGIWDCLGGNGSRA